jgi:hypothetical protein
MYQRGSSTGLVEIELEANFAAQLSQRRAVRSSL